MEIVDSLPRTVMDLLAQDLVQPPTMIISAVQAIQGIKVIVVTLLILVQASKTRSHTKQNQ